MTRLTTILASGTALMLSLSPALAQTEEATDGDAQVGGQPIAEAIREADAPDIAETDPVNETAQSEIGGTEMAREIESFARLVYDSGYRAGYEEGLRDAQEAIITEMRLRAERQQHGMRDLPETSQGGSGDRSSDGDGSGSGSGSMSGSGEQSADGQGQSASDGTIRVEETQNGGTVIVLPPGVSPADFMSFMMRQSQAPRQN